VEDLHFGTKTKSKKTGMVSPTLKYAFDIMCFNKIQVIVIWNYGGPPQFQNQLCTCDKQSVCSQFWSRVFMVMTMQLRILALKRSSQEMNILYHAKWVRSNLFLRIFMTREQALVVDHQRQAEVQQKLSDFEDTYSKSFDWNKYEFLTFAYFWVFCKNKKKFEIKRVIPSRS
jgi:hypothetical protein